MAGKPMASLDRGLSILVLIGNRGEMTAQGLSRALSIPLSTVYRHLATLIAHDLVEEDQGIYCPGPGALALSGQALTSTALAGLVGDLIAETSEALGQTVAVSVRSGCHAVCLTQSRGPHPDRLTFKMHQLLPLHSGAGQRVLLAYAPRSVLRAVCRTTPISPTGRQFSFDELQQLTREVLAEGRAVTRGELYRGSVAVAKPVLVRGEAICSLTAAGPGQVCDHPAWLERADRLLGRAAAELGQRLAAAEDFGYPEATTRIAPVQLENGS